MCPSILHTCKLYLISSKMFPFLWTTRWNLLLGNKMSPSGGRDDNDHKAVLTVSSPQTASSRLAWCVHRSSLSVTHTQTHQFNIYIRIYHVVKAHLNRDRLIFPFSSIFRVQKEVKVFNISQENTFLFFFLPHLFILSFWARSSLNIQLFRDDFVTKRQIFLWQVGLLKHFPSVLHVL